MENLGEQILVSFIGTLFDWSRAWGITSNDSLPMFVDSLKFCTYFVVFSWLLHVFFFHEVVFFNEIFSHYKKRVDYLIYI